MNILLTGGAGFIGTNLTKKLAENPINKITIIAKEERHFEQVKKLAYPNIFFRVSPYDINTDFEEIVKLDNEYIKKWSISLDIRIIFKTILVVLKRDGSQ